MEDKTIHLVTPLKINGRADIASITLRAPKYNDFMDLGEPEIFVRVKDSEQGGIFEPNIGVIRQYIERLTRESVDVNFLHFLTLADAMRLKGAVLSFFREAMLTSGDWIIPGISSPEVSSLDGSKPSEASAG